MENILKKIIFILILIKLTIAVAIAQAPATITGRLVDLNNEPVVGAYVIIQTVDSAYINSTSSDVDGFFSIKSNISKYILFVEHISHEPFFKEFMSGNVGTVVLTEAKNMLI